MKPHEQDKIISDLMEDFNSLIRKKLKQDLPENWNGHHIRMWIADLWNENYIFDNGLSKKEKREYKNDIIVNNLT